MAAAALLTGLAACVLAGVGAPLPARATARLLGRSQLDGLALVSGLRVRGVVRVLVGRAVARVHVAARDRDRRVAVHRRSEEHTSELQSRQYLVCRLLLEKKKTT